MPEEIFILGGHQTDFSKNWTREGQSFFDMMSETVLIGLETTGLSAKDIDVVHIGNFVAELFTGQGLLGGFLGHIHEDFSGLPTSRHEAACASGSLAILAAMSDLKAGIYDTACVLGAELMRNVPGKTASDYLGAAVWVGKEAQDATYIWPKMFSDLADVYDERWGLNYTHLSEISKKNYDNAKSNPNAQTRSWKFSPESFKQDDELNPVIEGWMRRQDCGQVSDGGAVLFLANTTGAERYCTTHGINITSLPRIQGWGHTTAPILFNSKIQSHESEDYLLKWTRKAITDAYRRAEISGHDDLDLIETHDCFSITEYMAIEHFGITKPGEAWKAIEDGTIHKTGRLPINPSGGLIGCGHPVGATGIRMMLDAFKQVSGTAGGYQVEGAKRAAMFNVGGSGTANCAFVIGR